MYRPKKKGNLASGIKGPNSALTQFLREEGISAETIRERWLQQRKGKKSGSGSGTDSRDISPSSTPEKKRSKEQPEDDLPDLGSDLSSESDSEIPARSATFFDSDEEEYEKKENTPVLTPRSTTPAQDQNKSRKILQTRRKKLRKTTDSLSLTAKKALTLQDLCINKISDIIYKWQNDTDSMETSLQIFQKLRETLGGVSLDNLNNLANALSKNRALNDTTLQLFLKTELEELKFYDCSKVSYEGYKTLAIFSPHIKSLSLQMCGQLNNEALLYLVEKLPHLSDLYLDGPFLINEMTWNEFFEKMEGRLKTFHISNTHRFTNQNLLKLLTCCGGTLESLELSRLDSISEYQLLSQYLKNDHFHTLSIEYPYEETDVNDEVIVPILKQISSSLKTLELVGCSELTDATINGLCECLPKTHCPLKTLRLEELENITNEPLIRLFKQHSLVSLERFSLKRCIKIGDPVLLELYANVGNSSLESLNLNSLKELTKHSLERLKCPKLEYLDLSFVRCVDDALLHNLGEQNANLQVIDVFGDNLVTEELKVRSGLKIVGSQSLGF